MSDLLKSLRQIVNDDATAATPNAAAANAPIAKQSGHDPRWSDSSKLPDMVMLKKMQTLFGGTALENLYFLPREGRMSAQVETPQGEMTLFSGYNYLGLGSDERVVQRTVEAVQRFGTHAGAARMVGGEIAIHAELEQTIAKFVGAEHAVVTVGGYVANLAAIGYLLGPNDLLIHDSYMHNSTIMGGVLSQARRMSFHHNDLDHLESLLEQHRGSAERTIILVEGAYSMDGDIADLPRLLEIKKRHNAWLMVDEAHSIGSLGATGRGLSEHFGTDPREIDLIMGTLSKSFGSCGGFFCCNADFDAVLRNFAPGYLLYSTGISPANTAAALAAIEVLDEEPERVQRLQTNAKLFCDLAREAGLDIGDAGGLVPIVPVMIGDDMRTLKLAARMMEEGILAHPILYPVVPRNSARIRFFITADHSADDIRKVINLMAEELV